MYHRPSHKASTIAAAEGDEGTSIGHINLVDSPMAAAHAILATDDGIEGICRLYEYTGLLPLPNQPQPSRGRPG